MAKVVRLPAGENPPDDEKWALVVREEAVRAADGNITLHSEGATFTAPDGADASAVIAQAAEWADAEGVATVYVRL